MKIFLLVFAMFLIVVFAMAIGYIVQRKSISGSCGGLSSIGIDKACDCDDPCDKRKAKMEKEKSWQENRII
ncbi:(Na+)-NQR maturation NqrM [Algibacillus agarilyticus]|uniref:(Na+)-NQR maturation NqrM n=1 Tax=Algibacillus agarilyticus TaxID=2234133 RepID=UPI000DD03209|nr:(Na+)-NQR maturation NqrM [Algibacillus agarilyticus]